MLEVLAPTMIDYARPELAAEMVPRCCRGEETVVPGLLRARLGQRPGLADHPRRCSDGDNWVINGQKVWTSFAQFSHAVHPAHPHR